MYRLEYLPIAKLDVAEIARYISHELLNPAAAERIANKMVEAAEGLVDFPYAYPVYYPIKPLKHEYRHLVVQNYLMFYFVDEAQKLITITRVIYARQDYEKLLD